MPSVRFGEVGACELSRFSRAHCVDIYVFMLSREECLQREVLQHRCARSAALGVRLHRRQGVLDLVLWTTPVRMLVGGAMFLRVFAVLVTMVVAFTLVMFGGLDFLAMMGVILVSARARMYVGEVRCVSSGQA